jgi:hypothetical protein
MCFENIALWNNMWKYGNLIHVTDVKAIFGHVIKQSQKYMSVYLK